MHLCLLPVNVSLGLIDIPRKQGGSPIVQKWNKLLPGSFLPAPLFVKAELFL
jgi:hypothetical protein